MQAQFLAATPEALRAPVVAAMAAFVQKMALELVAVSLKEHETTNKLITILLVSLCHPFQLVPDTEIFENFIEELLPYCNSRHTSQVWDKHIGFVKADFLGFLEECVTVVGSRKTSTRGHFHRSGISIDENE